MANCFYPAYKLTSICSKTKQCYLVEPTGSLFVNNIFPSLIKDNTDTVNTAPKSNMFFEPEGIIAANNIRSSVKIRFKDNTIIPRGC
jgi:hypothetical protein